MVSFHGQKNDFPHVSAHRVWVFGQWILWIDHGHPLLVFLIFTIVGKNNIFGGTGFVGTYYSMNPISIWWFQTFVRFWFWPRDDVPIDFSFGLNQFIYINRTKTCCDFCWFSLFNVLRVALNQMWENIGNGPTFSSVRPLAMGFGGWGKGKFGGGWSPWQPMCLGKETSSRWIRKNGPQKQRKMMIKLIKLWIWRYRIRTITIFKKTHILEN